MGDEVPSNRVRLLRSDDPHPVGIVNRSGRAPFLLVGDHAGDSIPGSLGTLGLGAADRARHIACDLGTRALGSALAGRLDATFVHQRFSRLVVDCNRDPARPDAMPATSDGSAVPGNAAIAAADRARRVAEVHAPYHAAIAAALDRRRASGQPTILVSLHSFTPRLAGGDPRPWHVGVLHDGGEDRFARALLATLARTDGIVAGDNEPYRMDATDYTVPRHALAAGLPYAEIEIRQDLLRDADGVRGWTATLGAALAAAAAAVGDVAHARSSGAQGAGA